MDFGSNVVCRRASRKTRKTSYFAEYYFGNLRIAKLACFGKYALQHYENSEFVLGISKDRGDYIGIDLGSKIRRKPRAQMRGPWSMSHLRGYLDGEKDHFKFKNIREEVSWIEGNEMELFDTSLLNSDGLNQWAVKASRRLFGQDSN